MMTLSLSNVILHQIKKQADGSFLINLRDQLLNHCPSTQDLVATLHQSYNAKAGIGFGQFSSQSEFSQWVKSTRKHEMDFKQFSAKAAEKLKQELTKYTFAEEGVLIFAEYQTLATEYLFIGLVNSQTSIQVTDDLEVNATAYLDVAKMDIAARIDLSNWETEPDSNRYLSYIKGRVGRKIADFFLDFMQAEVGLNTKQQNAVLMQAVDDYCSEAVLKKEEKQEYRQKVYDYCTEQLKSGDELVVKELASALPKDPQGNDFYTFTTEKGYQLEQQFPVDKASVRQLKKFVGAGGGLSINFDSLLLDERVFYDAQTDTLTIKGIPPNLRDQLARYLKDN